MKRRKALKARKRVCQVSSRQPGVPGRASLWSRPKGDYAEKVPSNSRGEPATAVATPKPHWVAGPLRRTSAGEDRRRSLGQRKQPRTVASARLELGKVEGLEGQTGGLYRPRGEPHQKVQTGAQEAVSQTPQETLSLAWLSQQKESVLQRPTRGKWNPGGRRSDPRCSGEA